LADTGLRSAEHLADKGGQDAPKARRALPLPALTFGLVLLVHLCALYWPRVEVQGPVPWTDKVVHVLLFLAPVVAGMLARVRAAYLVPALAAHAPVSELVQHFLLPGRSGDPWDAVADLSGVVLGVTLVAVGRRLRRW